MSDPDHRIGALRITVTAPDAAAASDVAAMVQEGLEPWLMPALSDAFDRACGDARLLRIDRLEVDLGAVDLADPDLPEQLATAVAEALRQQMPARDGLNLLIADLAGFLATGCLPFPAPGPGLARLAADLAARPVAEFATVADRLRAVLASEPSARRAAEQLPASLIARLLLTLAGEPDSGDARAAVLASTVPRLLRAEMAHLLRLLARSGPVPDADRQAVRRLAAALRGDDRTRAVATVQTDSTAQPADRPDEARESSVDPNASPAPVPSDNGEALAVPCAGLVLLHPFLPAFLKAVGVVDDAQRFANPVARARAVVLLQALATGAASAAEPDLVLPKLLCGLSPEQPVPREVTFSDGELAEIDGLLRAAIGHWARLGATGPDGLREGFLRRPGQLLPDPSGGLLQVEPRGRDVLLDALPWPLSPVRTPWMTAPLLVAWRM